MNKTETIDNHFMALALEQAQKAFDAGEIPIGAVVASPSGEILGSGYNQTEMMHCQSRHAEIIAIENACKTRADWRLSNCTIYITLEPCFMCVGLITLSRIERIVFGAKSDLFGYDLDKYSLPDLYQKHIKGITGGVMVNEAQLLLKNFFKLQRKKG